MSLKIKLIRKITLAKLKTKCLSYCEIPDDMNQDHHMQL